MIRIPFVTFTKIDLFGDFLKPGIIDLESLLGWLGRQPFCQLSKLLNFCKSCKLGSRGRFFFRAYVILKAGNTASFGNYNMNDALTMQEIQRTDDSRNYENSQKEAKHEFGEAAHWRINFELILNLEFYGSFRISALGEDVDLGMGEVQIRQVDRLI